MATLEEIKRRIRQPLDMEEELFVEEDELLDYINAGVKECSEEIHNLNEDYFKTDSNITTVIGTSAYDLPSDIYARKIRSILFNNGSERYEILPILDRDKMLVRDNDLYKYALKNSTTSGPQLVLYPAAREASASNITVNYIRDVILLEDNADELDIPEFEQFVIEYARVKILEKEMENPMLETAKANLAKSKDLMIRTLQESVPDGNNDMEIDTSFYNDFYSSYYGDPYSY